MKKMSKKILTGLMMTSLLASMLPTTGLAAGSAFGKVSLETKLNNDIVVYSNNFNYPELDKEADVATAKKNKFNNELLNKDVPGGFHYIGESGALAYTTSGDYKPSGSGPSTTERSNYKDPQIRIYSGAANDTKAFYIDLDYILEQYGHGTYTFSFTTSMMPKNGLVEACLNTLEDQTKLGEILRTNSTDGNHSKYVNFGGHILVNHQETQNSAAYNWSFTSTTYIPEDAQHLRFFFGGSDRTSTGVGGSGGWKAAYFDNLVITKKANSYKDAALANGNIKLKSTISTLNGVASATGQLVAAMYDADTGALLNTDISEEITVTSTSTVESTLPYPGGNVKDYVIKTFFFDGFETLAPYTLAYNPHESLMPNVSFEAPFTDSYRWTESGNNVDTKPAYVYSGNRAIGRGITSGGTYIKIGEGKTATANGTVATPTALSNVLHENGMGKYKVSFMARTRDNNASAYLMVKRHVQGTKEMDAAIGKYEVSGYPNTAAQTITNEWKKFEYELDFYPRTHSGGSNLINYRQNNYPFYIVASSTNANDAIYIDDFKVEKISE